MGGVHALVLPVGLQGVPDPLARDAPFFLRAPLYPAHYLVPEGDLGKLAVRAGPGPVVIDLVIVQGHEGRQVLQQAPERRPRPGIGVHLAVFFQGAAYLADIVVIDRHRRKFGRRSAG